MNAIQISQKNADEAIKLGRTWDGKLWNATARAYKAGDDASAKRMSLVASGATGYDSELFAKYI